ncbi:MAG: helix-turn-helix transcriptional regulator, partial [Actinomycetes bacterium]
MRALDPQASPAALFGAELRDLRVRQHLSTADLGRKVNVSRDLIIKIEKAERRAKPELAKQLDRALGANGRLLGIALESTDDVGELPSSAGPTLTLTPEDALPRLRHVVDTARKGDHAMDAPGPAELLAHARAAERLQHVGRTDRPRLYGSIAEAYQLAGWMAFDHGRLQSAEKLLSTARDRAARTGDPALMAYILGPNLSLIATRGGDPARGVELAWSAIGSARRSGNRRLAAFTMAIGARAHACLGERDLCLGLLDDAELELASHDPG